MLYNVNRPHQALPGRITPQAAWDATPKADPPRPLPVVQRRAISNPAAIPAPQGRATAGIRVATIHLNGTIKARGIWFNISHTRRGQDVYVIYERDSLMIFDDHGTLIIEHPWPAPGVRYVDTVRRRVFVEENAVLVGSSIEVGTPKTHEARSVIYPRFLDSAMARAAASKQPNDLLFGDGVAHMRLPNSRDGWFAAAVKRVQRTEPGFPRVTPHDLRHTAASLAIASGANVKAVQRMLGHASAAMTLDVYGDLFDDDLDAVAEALDHARATRSVSTSLTASLPPHEKDPDSPH